MISLFKLATPVILSKPTHEFLDKMTKWQLQPEIQLKISNLQILIPATIEAA